MSYLQTIGAYCYLMGLYLEQKKKQFISYWYPEPVKEVKERPIFINVSIDQFDCDEDYEKMVDHLSMIVNEPCVCKLDRSAVVSVSRVEDLLGCDEV